MSKNWTESEIPDIPISDARNELTSLPERMKKDVRAISISRRGKPVLAVLQWELYESLIETLQILGDPEMLEAFRQGVRELRQGKGISWEGAKRKLGL